MGSIYKMEGKPINIPEGDIVKIILQRCVRSAVKSLAELRGIVTTGIPPTGEKYKYFAQKLRELTDCEERGRTRRQRRGQSERWAH